MKRFYEERKKEKSVENPKIRSGDPACWDCLSNEQRDVICEWYYDMKLEEIEKEEKLENRFSFTSILALVPFAVSYAYHAPGNWVSNFVGSWFIHSFVFWLFNSGYQNAIEMNGRKNRTKVEIAIGFTVLAVAGAFASWIVLNWIYG